MSRRPLLKASTTPVACRSGAGSSPNIDRSPLPHGADGKVRAFDTDTGKILWTGTLPGASRGVPTMYKVDGRQYLVINATQGAVRSNPTKADAPDRAYVAFALKK